MKIKLIIPENQKHLFIIFILAWACINLLQAVFTDTISDETYYALYGENLNWGYYDHPPMVGLMTYISNILFDGNLSIRFITVVLQIFALALIWKTIDTVQVSASLFFIISASLIMFQAYGFITTPDAPLLFFMALFLFVYKKFIGDKNLYNTVLLAVSMAGMIYSKYHGILIAGFIFLSNPRLFLSYKTYIAGLVTVLLLFPHIYWQFANNFPGFKYHLNDRSDTFEWIYFLEYIPNQLAVFNPLTFGAAAYVIAKRKPADVFERGLYFIIVGVISFFWVSAFRGHVEPHWTVACSVPIIILLYKRSFEDKKLMKYIKKAVAYSVILIFIVRIALVSGLVPDFDGKKATEFRAIQSVAGNLPTVFTSSFQNPSNYHFFTGKESVTLSSVTGRQTQFDVMRKELEYQGKPAFIVTKNDFTNLFDFACEKQGTRNKEQGTRNKEQGTRNKEQGTRNKEQGTRNKEQGT
ncbi:MAG: glycosyltransferase family 39 protein, partial [Prevotellaceae bacterium]|nr:glycosyltransferase family 39 protein [Prevotellaceae bacterium]